MDRLPGEILLEIFILLHQTDKVECMKVCRKWEYTVREFCLLHTICISRHRQIKQLLRKFKKEPHQGELVERVFVFGLRDMVEAAAPLLAYFPNPREVCLPTLNLTEEQAKSKTYQNWSDYIQHLTEYRSLDMTTTLLKHNVYSRLETLTLFKQQSGHERLMEVVGILPNVPTLKELILERFEVTVDSLEALHNAAPSLEVLSFNNALVIGFDHVLKKPSSMNIQPTTLLKSFAVGIQTIVADVQHLSLFFEYTAIKYPNLEQLSLTNAYYYIHADQVKALYNDAIVPFCQKLGPQLKKLTSFMYDTPQNLFEWMDLADCRVKDLDLCVSSSDWSSSAKEKVEQLSYIERLALNEVTSFDFNWLRHCTVLKEIQLSFSSNRVKKFELDCFIKCLPRTVTTITIAYAELHYDKNHTGQVPHVKNLELKDIQWTDGVDRYISRVFPQLRILKLFYCNMSYKRFDFSGLRLFYLHIDDIFTKSKLPTETLLIKTSDKNENRLYKKMRFKKGAAYMGARFTKYDKSIYPENKLMCYEKFPHDPLITFECTAVKNIIY